MAQVSPAGELLDLAVQHEIIKKSGAWFSYGDERIGQGRDNAKMYLEEHPEMAAGIEAQVRQALTLPQMSSETLAASAQAASIDDGAYLWARMNFANDKRRRRPRTRKKARGNKTRGASGPAQGEEARREAMFCW